MNVGAEAATAERVKILIVNGQPEALHSTQVVLGPLGEEIVPAQSAREALTKVMEDDFAVIVLDVMAPGMNGLETAALIRTREWSRDTPIIFLTPPGKSEEYLFRGYDLGAVDYLFEPVAPHMLRAKVACFAAQARKRQLLERRNLELQREILLREDAGRETEKLNGHLERRVEELSGINRELEAFSYSVSHDLRAPLSRIAGFSQALREGYRERLDETGRLYLERICTSSQRVCELVDDLLNLARLGRIELRRQHLDLSGMARGLLAEIASREPDRRVETEVPEGVSASGDPVLVKAVLQNLLENAWKFTRRSERARIEFGAVPDEVPAYFVRDNGAGFDMRQSARLFQPFQRLHQDSEFQGTGIGLAIVDRIVKRHGGRVWAEAVPDRGATFYFTLQGQGG